MKVRYSPRAIQDLENVRLYISKDNPSSAWVVASFIRRSILMLELWPYRGRATEAENIRRLVVMNYPYAVLYRVDDGGVLILAVNHTSQNR